MGSPIAGRTRRSWRGSSASSSTRWCCARGLDGEHVLPRAAGAGAGHDAGRVRAPGRALREAGGGAAAGARPEPHAAVPGDVRAAERAAARTLALPGWRCEPLEMEQRHVEVRPDAASLDEGRTGWRARSSTAPTCSTPRRVRADGGAPAGAAGGRGGAARTAPCRELPLLGAEERQRMLVEWNAHARGVPADARRARAVRGAGGAHAGRGGGGVRGRSADVRASWTRGPTSWRITCARWAWARRCGWACAWSARWRWWWRCWPS